MKSISQTITKLSFCLICVFSINAGLTAQNQVSTPVSVAQTITMLVPGICDMCKNRIESAAMDVPGVKKAEWDIKTDTLVVIGTAKMSKQKIADALAKAGYRSELAAADPKAYKKLPACCQYDSGLDKH